MYRSNAGYGKQSFQSVRSQAGARERVETFKSPQTDRAATRSFYSRLTTNRFSRVSLASQGVGSRLAT